ncbi:MAG: ComF family protein [Clostridia bacterium]|nr:ComF family protein [Clostridia bacterium]
MKLIEDFHRFVDKYLFNRKWKCLACNKEIFDGDFCESCLSELAFIGENKCFHCGRETKTPTDYCLTCKGNLTAIDRGVSVFTYKKPISKLIQKLKYFNERYLAEPFAEYLVKAYNTSGLTADLVTFVPMTAKAERKRRFNQSKLIAEKFSEHVGVKIKELVVKTVDTAHQVGLTATQRKNNLSSAFKVKDKAAVKDKAVLIIDDVATTGATGEAIAEKLKKAGASAVYLLTVASVPYDKELQGE